MVFDKKTKWEQKRIEAFEYLTTPGYYPLEYAKRIRKNVDGIYETPKTYVDGVAYNDGSWLIYNTDRKAGGTYRNTVYCKSKDDLFRYIYEYLLFLRKVGVEDSDELFYYTLCYGRDKLVFPSGMFNWKKDIEKVVDMTRSVAAKAGDDIELPSRKDSRKFAFDPELLKTLDRASYTRLQNQVEKKITDDRIGEYYQPGLSIRKNQVALLKNGVKVSRGRLENWIKEYGKCPL